MWNNTCKFIFLQFKRLWNKLKVSLYYCVFLRFCCEFTYFQFNFVFNTDFLSILFRQWCIHTKFETVENAEIFLINKVWAERIGNLKKNYTIKKDFRFGNIRYSFFGDYFCVIILIGTLEFPEVNISYFMYLYWFLMKIRNLTFFHPRIHL